MHAYSLLTAVAFAALCAALSVAGLMNEHHHHHDDPPGVAELAAAGVDAAQVYERCTSSEFGWCMRAEYAEGKR